MEYENNQIFKQTPATDISDARFVEGNLTDYAREQARKSRETIRKRALGVVIALGSIGIAWGAINVMTDDTTPPPSTQLSYDERKAAQTVCITEVNNAYRAEHQIEDPSITAPKKVLADLCPSPLAPPTTR